jgi:membrane protease YdiL (CAAX protease family)
VPEWADGIVRIALFKIKGSDPISIAREKSNALTDLILMGVVFWSVWSLRFIGATFVGALTMGAGIVLVLILQRWRGKPLSDIGIQSVASLRWLVSHTGQAMMYIGLTMLVVGGLVSLLLGAPSESAAITQQPQGFWFFLLDVTLITWVLIGFGEEFVFRGFILNRLLSLTGSSGRAPIVACLLQAVWFGAGHASQGLTGMVITGAIGFVLAMAFLYRMNRNLWPLVIAHAGIDSTVLTVSWLSG